MQDPEAYIRGNNLQLRATLELLNDYTHLIQWKKAEEVVMDLGCGPGNVTWDVLKKKLPDNCGAIYGVDIEKRMIEFAKRNYPAINFVQSDIASVEFGAQFKNSVDHLFSFYCFQWIHDQRQLLKNLFDILKPGGDILTIFPATHPVCDAYEKMLKIDKWKKYKKELEWAIIFYQFHKNIEKSLKELLTETGFEILMCKCEDYTHVFESMQELKNFVIGINPLQKYPTNIVNSFVCDVMKEFQKMDFVKRDESQIVVSQKNIYFCVRKPYNN